VRKAAGRWARRTRAFQAGCRSKPRRQSCSKTLSVSIIHAYRAAVWQSRHNILAHRRFWGGGLPPDLGVLGWASSWIQHPTSTRLLGAFGEYQVMGQPEVKRLFVSPLMIKGVRGCCLLLARSYYALPTLNHQKWRRARML
jgi:hypothetical protein